MSWKGILWVLATAICDICALCFGYTSLWVLGFFLTLILLLSVVLILCSFGMLSFRQVLLQSAVEKQTEAQLAVQCCNKGIFLYPTVKLYYRYHNKKEIAVYPGVQEIRTGYIFPRKGQYSIGLKKIVVYEPFGLFFRRISFRKPEILYVLPKPASIPYSSRNELGESLEGGTRKKQVADRSTVSDLREYEYGDTLNSINWKATAKRNRVIVNRYENEFCPRIFVFVDGRLQTEDRTGVASMLDDCACDMAVTQIKSVLQQEGAASLFYGWQDRILESNGVKSFQEYGIYLTEYRDANAEAEQNRLSLLQTTLMQKTVYNRAIFYLKDLTPEIAQVARILENQHVTVELYRMTILHEDGKTKAKAVLITDGKGVGANG